MYNTHKTKRFFIIPLFKIDIDLIDFIDYSSVVWLREVHHSTDRRIPGKKKKRRRAQGKRNARRNENDGRFVACIISINYEYEYKTLSNFVTSKVKITVSI